MRPDAAAEDAWPDGKRGLIVATTTNYIWDEENLLAETDENNVVQTVYTNEPEQYGNLISSRISGTTSYHHFDAIGSTRQLTNGAGAVTDTVTYDAWGNVVNRVGATAKRLGWNGASGYYEDTETGSYYVRRRIYAARCARWGSLDDLFFDGPNRYTYVRNRPMTSVDPAGMLAVQTVAPSSGANPPKPDAVPAIYVSICGNWSWQVKFVLEAKERNGFIIQHVRLTTLIRWCKDNKALDKGLMSTGDCPKILEESPAMFKGTTEKKVKASVKQSSFWELWVVRGGNVYLPTTIPPVLEEHFTPWHAKDPHDKLEHLMGQGVQSRTIIAYTQTAEAYWVAGNVPPGGWDKWQEKVGLALQLPTSCQFNLDGLPKRPSATRTVNNAWDCCCALKSDKCETTYKFTSDNEQISKEGRMVGCTESDTPLIPIDED